MCVSRLHQVVAPPSAGSIEVCDVGGARHVVSLLALDGPAPAPGDWLVVHSGYAIDRVEHDEAEQVAAELRGALGVSSDEVTEHVR